MVDFHDNFNRNLLNCPYLQLTLPPMVASLYFSHFLLLSGFVSDRTVVLRLHISHLCDPAYPGFLSKRFHGLQFFFIIVQFQM